MLKKENKGRKAVILITAVAVTVLIYLFLWGGAGMEGLLPAGMAAAKAERELAPGIWGTLGFYADPSDNAITLILIGLCVVSAIARFHSRFSGKPRAGK